MQLYHALFSQCLIQYSLQLCDLSKTWNLFKLIETRNIQEFCMITLNFLEICERHFRKKGSKKMFIVILFYKFHAVLSTNTFFKNCWYWKWLRPSKYWNKHDKWEKLLNIWFSIPLNWPWISSFESWDMWKSRHVISITAGRQAGRQHVHVVSLVHVDGQSRSHSTCQSRSHSTC